MNKSKPIQISIPAPCSQNRDEMTRTTEGRFCIHCQKTVIDFTTWSDATLYNFFSKNTGKVCGTFFEDQLNRPINIPYQPHSKLYRITIAIGLTLIFTQTPNAFAQNRPPKTEQNPLLKRTTPTGNKSGGISGKVLDEKKEPLPSAIVEVYKDSILKGGAATDIDGNYKIDSLESGSYNVLILYVGYDSIKKDVVVANDSFAKLDFELSSKDIITTVGETILGVYPSKIPPLIDIDNPTKRTFTREEINHTPQ